MAGWFSRRVEPAWGGERAGTGDVGWPARVLTAAAAAEAAFGVSTASVGKRCRRVVVASSGGCTRRIGGDALSRGVGALSVSLRWSPAMRAEQASLLSAAHAVVIP